MKSKSARNPTTDKNKTFAPSPYCLTRRLSAEITEIHRLGEERGNAVFEVEGVSAFIWSKIGLLQTRKQIVDSVVSNYAVTPARAGRDLNSLIKQLSALRLVQELKNLTQTERRVMNPRRPASRS